MLWHEFKDAAAMLYSSTAAGGTLEKALRDTCCDMKTSDSSYQVLLPEFERICMHLDQNRSLESVLEDFAVRSEDEDIAYFVRVLTVARKSGGSLSSIIRHTADTMNLRMEINSEMFLEVDQIECVEEVQDKDDWFNYPSSKVFNIYMLPNNENMNGHRNVVSVGFME